MCSELMAEEHGFNLGESEEPKVEVEEHAMTGFNLGESEEPKGEVEEHAMSGFDLGKSEEPKIKVEKHAMTGFDPGKSEEPKVEVEDTENLAHDERHKTEDGAFETLDENHDTQSTTAKCHYNEAFNPDEEPSDNDSEDSETSEEKGEAEAKDVEETEVLELTNLEPAWQMLELAKNGNPDYGNLEHGNLASQSLQSWPTNPNRCELVKMKPLPEKKNKESVRMYKWAHCALSQQVQSCWESHLKCLSALIRTLSKI